MFFESHVDPASHQYIYILCQYILEVYHSKDLSSQAGEHTILLKTLKHTFQTEALTAICMLKLCAGRSNQISLDESILHSLMVINSSGITTSSPKGNDRSPEN